MPFRRLLSMLRPTSPIEAAQPAPRGQGEEVRTGSCGQLIARDGRALPLRGVSLRAEARAGVARVVLVQRFVNPHPDPLHVSYLMPLPADAAVSGYAFTLGDRRVVGEIDRKASARQRFEQAVLEGRTAGLVEQERTSLFTQELGNVPPHEEIVAELTLDQRLIWLAEGAWEWRFPTAVGPRYVGAEGTVPDAARLSVDVAEGGVDARLSLALQVGDALAPAGVISSPSHRVRSEPKLHVPPEARAADATSPEPVQVALEDSAGARLDRDVVVRWPVATATVGAVLDVARPGGHDEAYGLLTLVPPEPARQRAQRRDLILLLDTSGSMAGEPLDQLKRAAHALIDTLRAEDTLEMIEFSTSAQRWRRGAVTATQSTRAEAARWISNLAAGGGTEMVSGMLEALRPLTPTSQRQVVLMTDGFIGDERGVVSQVMAHLPRGACRVHVVGVGSSVNRTLTTGVARAGTGVELICAPGEDVEPLIGRLLARTASPLVTQVEVHGDALIATAPAFLPDLYAGSPALISLQLRAAGGTLELRGHTADGPWRESLVVPACPAERGSPALAKLFARETVEDLELAHTTASAERAEIDRAIEELGLRYQISTRLTTWVAISAAPTVDPSQPQRRERVAHELPHGVSAEGMGLRRSSTMASAVRPGQPMFGQRLEMDDAESFEALRSELRSPPPGRPAGGRSAGLVPPAPSAPLPAPSAPLRKEKARSRELAKTDDADPKPQPRSLRARLWHRSGATLVFELDVLLPLAWRPGIRVELLLADGRRLTARVLPASTGAGTYATHQVLRLAVELGNEGELAAGEQPIALMVDGLRVPVVVN
ncbi:MAG: VIT domain-containing protein [Kofleriaceae bacterium]